MNHLKGFVRRSSLLTMAIALFGLWTAADLFILTSHASAAQITERSLKISSSANGSIAVGNPGEGGNGQKAKYTFGFKPATSGAIQSILFQACTTPLPGTTCTSPTGMTMANLAGSTLTTTGTNFTTGFSVDSSTDLTGAPYNCSGTSPGRTNCFAVKRTDATSVASGTALTLTFAVDATHYVTNPTADNSTFFVRITTYSTNTFTTSVDQGTVANATAEQIDVTAKVQETLNFSVGTTPTTPNTTCDPLTGSALALGDSDGVLSFQQAYDKHTYFRVSTNANNGTAIYYSGDTLKNGANSIAAIGTTATASAVGTSQFGISIDSSDTQSGSGHLFNSLTATAPYNAGNGTITNGGTATFAFDTTSVTTPKEIASSVSSGTKTIVCDTGSVRYLGNISTTTPPGIYTTTISYLALPTY